MTRFHLTLTSTLALAGLVTALVLGSGTKLREENQALHRDAQALLRLQAENERLSNQVARAHPSQPSADPRLNELLRLRGEAVILRQQTNELAKLQEQNQTLRAAPPAPAPATPAPPFSQSLPRESWSFAGYADAESAFVTTVWAMSRGDVNAFITSLPSQDPGPAFQGKSPGELAAMIQPPFEGVSAIKLLGKRTVSPDEVIVHARLEGVNDVVAFRLRRVNAEWKFAGYATPPRTR